MREYPEDYTGPKAGVSSDEEWLSITEYQAFKHLKFNDWSYSDFDCWLGARDEWHYNRGTENAVNALKEFQQKYNIKTEIKPRYEKD